MKRCAVLIAILCLVGLVVQAGPAKGGGDFGNPAAPIMKSPVGKLFALADTLEITDEQLVKLRALFRTHRERMKELGENLRVARQKVHTALKEDKMDDLGNLAAELGKLQGMRVTYMLGFFVDLRKTITPAQWEKIKNMRLQKALKRHKEKARRQKRQMGNMQRKLKHLRRCPEGAGKPPMPMGPCGFAPPLPPPPPAMGPHGFPPPPPLKHCPGECFGWTPPPMGPQPGMGCPGVCPPGMCKPGMCAPGMGQPDRQPRHGQEGRKPGFRPGPRQDGPQPGFRQGRSRGRQDEACGKLPMMRFWLNRVKGLLEQPPEPPPAP